MNKTVLLFLLAALLTCQAAAKQQTLKALLYCYLPAVNQTDSTQQYLILARQINRLLEFHAIDVQVEVCNSTVGYMLYDATQINTLFKYYDILEVDTSYLWAITQNLLSFTKEEISYFHQVYPFQWLPTIKIINGEEKYIGSPGLLCSTFLQTRKDENYQDRLYAKFSSQSTIADLYLNTFVNLEQSRTLESLDYKSVDRQTINLMAEFLKECQKDTSSFNFDENWCTDNSKKNFFTSNCSKTVGYSQNLFKFINAGIETASIEIEHISTTKSKKIFYIDSFVAKETPFRQTVLNFYEFMISDQVLDIYIKGLYTDNQNAATYLIPPTRHYLQQLATKDPLYNSIFKSAFHNTQHLPVYQKQYAANLQSFTDLIFSALKEYKQQSFEEAEEKSFAELEEINVEQWTS